MSTPWVSDEDYERQDSRLWAFDYQARKFPKGPYENRQITDISYNIFVRRVKFLEWSQKPENMNDIGVIGRPYLIPGQGKKPLI